MLRLVAGEINIIEPMYLRCMVHNVFSAILPKGEGDLIFKTSSLLPQMIKPLKMVNSNRKEFAPRANSFLLELTLLEKGGQKKTWLSGCP